MELLLLPHLSTSSPKCEVVLFTMEANYFTFISMLIYVHLNYTWLRGSVAGFSIPQQPCQFQTFYVVYCHSQTYHCSFKGQITPVILSLDAFVSGTCSQVLVPCSQLALCYYPSHIDPVFWCHRGESTVWFIWLGCLQDSLGVLGHILGLGVVFNDWSKFPSAWFFCSCRKDKELYHSVLNLSSHSNHKIDFRTQNGQKQINLLKVFIFVFWNV